MAEANTVRSGGTQPKRRRSKRDKRHNRDRAHRTRGVSRLPLVLGQVTGPAGSLGEDPVTLALAGAVQMHVMGDKALENQKQGHEPAQRDALASCV
jgi:hypothetical protein